MRDFEVVDSSGLGCKEVGVIIEQEQCESRLMSSAIIGFLQVLPVRIDIAESNKLWPFLKVTTISK